MTVSVRDVLRSARGGGTAHAGRYGDGVPVAAVNPFAVSPVLALPPDATPAAIRDALIDEERVEFERAYQDAIAEAAQTLDLTRVLDVLRNYHRIAWLTQRQGPEAHRRMLDHVEHALRTGKAPPGAGQQRMLRHCSRSGSASRCTESPLL
ncbi:MAG: DUF6247 family protein [Pseudonocardia sp.]